MTQETPREVAEKLILDAERFKANVDKPTGMPMPNLNLSTIVPLDDEFLHLTCHVDQGLSSKIKKGEYVDLEKLLPKDPTRKLTNENRMELVNRDRLPFFVPVTDKEKIGSVRKWKQASRVYAAIYSRANPLRSVEIWQYVYIINLAASSYSWENVACYDYTFRQLMHHYPSRSWSTIYHQMWSLAMRDPISRNGFAARNSSGGGDHQQRSQRDNNCWKFNKNKCKFGSRCRAQVQLL